LLQLSDFLVHLSECFGRGFQLIGDVRCASAFNCPVEVTPVINFLTDLPELLCHRLHQID